MPDDVRNPRQHKNQQQKASQQHQTQETRVREYYEQDGTKVVETTTLIRIQPSPKHPSGATNILEVDQNFYHQFLNYTNELRARHQAPPLKLFKDLINFADEWAKHLASINLAKHRQQNKFGENLYYKFDYSKITLNGYEPVQSWYDEIEHYQPYFGKDPPKAIFPKCGHFTNLVWKNSKRMGVAFCKGANTVFVVCYYDPPGNVFTEFKDNVLPPIDDIKPTMPLIKSNAKTNEDNNDGNSNNGKFKFDENGLSIKTEFKPVRPEAEFKKSIQKRQPHAATPIASTKVSSIGGRSTKSYKSQRKSNAFLEAEKLRLQKQREEEEAQALLAAQQQQQQQLQLQQEQQQQQEWEEQQRQQQLLQQQQLLEQEAFAQQQRQRKSISNKSKSKRAYSQAASQRLKQQQQQQQQVIQREVEQQQQQQQQEMEFQSLSDQQQQQQQQQEQEAYYAQQQQLLLQQQQRQRKSRSKSGRKSRQQQQQEAALLAQQQQQQQLQEQEAYSAYAAALSQQDQQQQQEQQQQQFYDAEQQQ